MPGNRPHHTEKMRSCVEQVMAQGHEESSAYAICTTSMQKAGEPIYEAATRHLHLRGALGTARTEMWEGREHLVVPVVALMEGVIHAVNAEYPEYVPVTALEAARDSWNGRPIVLGHPSKGGKQISAYEPGVIDKVGFGFVRQSQMNGTRLGMEALIDPAKLEALGQQELLRDLRAGKPIEVSVGAFVRTNSKEGNYKGKKYKAEWLEIFGDHLAFLPNGIGACSMEMGCGANRAACHLVTAEGIEAEQVSDVENIVAQLRAAIGARNSARDLEMIQTVHDHATALGAKCSNRMETLEAATKPQLRAACGCASKGEGGMSLTKEKRAELIAALVTDKFSGYKEGDEVFLEGVPEERLEDFKAAAQARKDEADAREKLENEQRSLAAKTKVLEEKLRVAEVKPTEEEWLERAPESIRTLLDRQRDEDNRRRDELVTHLKTAQSEYAEEELKTMSIPELERLSKVVKVEKPNFSGRGIPQPQTRVARRQPQQQRAEETDDFTPPNPYEAGIKALQAQMGKTVN